MKYYKLTGRVRHETRRYGKKMRTETQYVSIDDAAGQKIEDYVYPSTKIEEVPRLPNEGEDWDGKAFASSAEVKASQKRREPLAARGIEGIIDELISLRERVKALEDLTLG